MLLQVNDDDARCFLLVMMMVSVFAPRLFYISVCLQKIFLGVAATQQQAVFL
jgi:hypothetical protein